MIFLYSVIFYIIFPFIPLYLLKRSYKNKNYRFFWKERFGFGLNKINDKSIIWLHSVSVGETRAMAKMVEIITNKYPKYQILITVMTPTGRLTAETLYPNAIVNYIPYDMPHAVIKFYKTYKPKVGLIMETEIWPNLIYFANKLDIPIFLVNARLSDKSFKSYLKFRFFISSVINCFNEILCQDSFTKENFIKLDFINRIDVIGNTKFDIVYNNKLIEYFNNLKLSIGNRKVVTFFSTREGEEDCIIGYMPKLIDYIVIIIPRHLERFKYVENLLIKNKISYIKRSDNIIAMDKTMVILGDSMGEMMQYYAISDLAVVGGSFSNNGGQNLLEPISLRKPVIFGDSMFNFEAISQNALKFNCAVKVDNIAECFNKIDIIVNDVEKYNNLVDNCDRFINHYTGASEKIIDRISKYL